MAGQVTYPSELSGGNHKLDLECQLPAGTDHIEKILVVDDDPQVCRMIARILSLDYFDVEVALSAEEAMDVWARSSCALVICDVHIGRASGLDLLHQLKSDNPNVAVLVISGDDRPLVASAAAERGGALTYLVKPFTANELRINVSNALLRRRLDMNATAYQTRLREAVEERTRELRSAIEGLRSSREATIRHLSKAVEMRDCTTHAHIDRIGEIAAVLAQHLGWPSDKVELLRVAAPMHDVGKIGIPDRILLKPGPLTPEERREMERHTVIGHEILSGSESELLNLAAMVALTHHEKIDGTGYPHGLRGEQIPEAGRIVAVADVFDALVNDRVYRAAMPLGDACAILRRGRGQHFDTRALDALFSNLEQIVAIQEQAASEPEPALLNLSSGVG